MAAATTKKRMTKEEQAPILEFFKNARNEGKTQKDAVADIKKKLPAAKNISDSTLGAYFTKSGQSGVSGNSRAALERKLAKLVAHQEDTMKEIKATVEQLKKAPAADALSKAESLISMFDGE